MVYEEIYLQLFFISFGMVLFSLLLNKILGITPETMKDVRDKATNLKDRIQHAQVLGDMRLMQELQAETMQLMKLMMKKQLVPLCLRCFIFIGIWIVLSFFYASYGPQSGFFFGLGWFLYYFLLAMGLSFAIMGIRYGYRKATGKEDRRTSFIKEMSQILNFSSLRQGAGTFYQMPTSPSTPQQPTDTWKSRIQSTTEWKDRIQKTIEDVEKSSEE